MTHEPTLPRCRPSTFEDRVADIGWSVLDKIIGGIALLVVSALLSAWGGLPQYFGNMLSTDARWGAGWHYDPEYDAGRGSRSLRYRRRAVRHRGARLHCPRLCACRPRYSTRWR
jgi:hypothetical protein